ncbi:MAG: hypothetical protein KH897_05645 [Bacteroides sp.]|jgi:hypothetical protein|uniref:hypothetical protein n=1 Tax=Bacteroides TaxID=816 RepID=UPI0025C491E9|nr:hypothetical protein [Bacteroides sp.]MBS6237866.1 hypothetical protein [Bacteroides sp.]
MIKEIIKYALGLLMALISGYIIRIYMSQWFGIAELTIIHSLFTGALGFCVGIWVVMIKNYQIKKSDRILYNK